MISIHAPTRGATIYLFKIFASAFISIHAPTRGATMCVQKCVKEIIISIHAPTRGATWYTIFTISEKNFNPRSYKRSDFAFASIKRGSYKFQSTLLQEERQPPLIINLWKLLFQSTLLQEERLQFFKQI